LQHLPVPARRAVSSGCQPVEPSQHTSLEDATLRLTRLRALALLATARGRSGCTMPAAGCTGLESHARQFPQTGGFIIWQDNHGRRVSRWRKARYQAENRFEGFSAVKPQNMI
jgi:hypothetical protein